VTAVEGDGGSRRPRRYPLAAQIGRLVRTIRDGDDAMVEEAVLQLSRSRRLFAPLALVVSAFAMLFQGVKLLVSNWRLTLVQLLPAMWIWVAMFDLKAHVLHGKSLRVLRGPVLIPIVLAIMAVTAGGFFLNAVFAFAVAKPGSPRIRPAFKEARSHLGVILGSGLVVGFLLALATMVVTRWGKLWFALSLSIVVGLMMVCYVSVPSRLIGARNTMSKRDKLTASAVGGALGAMVCAPPYAIGRVGILMLGSRVLFVPGIFLVALGVTLQAGATSAVKAIKMSAKLVAGRSEAAVDGADGPQPGVATPSIAAVPPPGP
jgi:hypothetical protein